jgi:hypothetical protein
MPKLKVVTIESDDALPADCPRPEPGAELLKLRDPEIVALMEEGAWYPPDSPHASTNWTAVGEDGSIWAGSSLRKGGIVAKVRGKGGRRLGQGRWAMDPVEKKVATSISLSPRTRESLYQLADVRTKAEGKRITISDVIEELVDREAIAPKR